jgi:hypothetical protein
MQQNNSVLYYCLFVISHVNVCQEDIPRKKSHFFVYARICFEYHIYISENSTTSVYQTAS